MDNSGWQWRENEELVRKKSSRNLQSRKQKKKWMCWLKGKLGGNNSNIEAADITKDSVCGRQQGRKKWLCAREMVVRGSCCIQRGDRKQTASPSDLSTAKAVIRFFKCMSKKQPQSKMHSHTHCCVQYKRWELTAEHRNPPRTEEQSGSICGSSAKVSESLCHTYNAASPRWSNWSCHTSEAQSRRWSQSVRWASKMRNRERAKPKTKQKAEISCLQPTLRRCMKRKAKQITWRCCALSFIRSLGSMSDFSWAENSVFIPQFKTWF